MAGDSPRALARRSPGYLPAVVWLDAVGDPGVQLELVFQRLKVRWVHSAPPVLPAPTLKGSARPQNNVVLGATCQIQGSSPSPRHTHDLLYDITSFRRYTSERLTRPYSGELPARAVLSQQATIARLPNAQRSTGNGREGLRVGARAGGGQAVGAASPHHSITPPFQCASVRYSAGSRRTSSIQTASLPAAFFLFFW